VWHFIDESDQWVVASGFKVEVFVQIDHCHSSKNPCDQKYETCTNGLSEAICEFAEGSCPYGVDANTWQECFEIYAPDTIKIEGSDPDGLTGEDSILGTYDRDDHEITDKRPSYTKDGIGKLWLVYDWDNKVWTLSELDGAKGLGERCMF
jgi:hypothetical protein